MIAFAFRWVDVRETHRRIAWTIGLLVIGLVWFVSPAYGQSLKEQLLAQEHGWLSRYEEARTLAKKSGKPLMVVFRCLP